MTMQVLHNQQTSLTREQKQAVGLLSIGTFLEYFDLMLYVHMAVLLNDLFFPKTDPFTASLLAAFAFCSTYVLRPIGALFFGYIGDNIGRKTTVIITTTLMSLSCFTMALLPTYQDIGITASFVVTICRIVQGMSSMGELVGAELYLTEITQPPIQYPAVAFISIATRIGSTLALSVAMFSMSTQLGWRVAFFMGSVIAVVGAIARRTLRETPVFADAKRRLANNLKFITDKEDYKKTVIWNEKVNIKTIFANFALISTWPIWFYIVYLYSSGILKNNFNYTSAQIITHNLPISTISLIVASILCYTSYKVSPLKIIKIRFIIFCILILPSIYLLDNAKNPLDVMIFQLIFTFFAPTSNPVAPILYKHFPIFKRFTYTSFIYALSRALVYVITSFGLVYLSKYFNNWGMLIIIIPALIGYYFARNHYEYLEKNSLSYNQ